jgi:hypothetical protein
LRSGKAEVFSESWRRQLPLIDTLQLSQFNDMHNGVNDGSRLASPVRHEDNKQRHEEHCQSDRHNQHRDRFNSQHDREHCRRRNESYLEAKTIANDTETIDFICKINDTGFVMINIVALTIIIDAIQPASIQQPGEIPDFDDYHCDGDNHFERKVDLLLSDFNLHRDDRNLLPRVEHRHPFPDDLHPRGSNQIREVHELIRRSDDLHCDGYQSLCDADDSFRRKDNRRRSVDDLLQPTTTNNH